MLEALLFSVHFLVFKSPIDGKLAAWSTDPMKKPTAQFRMKQETQKYQHVFRGNVEYGDNECFIFDKITGDVLFSATIGKVDVKDLPHV